MPPCFIFNELDHITFRCISRPRNQFLRKALSEVAVHLSNELATLDERIKVLLALVTAGIEIIENHARTLGRIIALECHPTRRVAGVGLQDDPGKFVAEALEILGVAPPKSPKEAW